MTSSLASIFQQRLQQSGSSAESFQSTGSSPLLEIFSNAKIEKEPSRATLSPLSSSIPHQTPKKNKNKKKKTRISQTDPKAGKNTIEEVADSTTTTTTTAPATTPSSKRPKTKAETKTKSNVFLPSTSKNSSASSDLKDKIPAPEGKDENEKEHSKDNLEVSKRTIFVGNFPADLKKKKLKQLFSEVGRVENLRFRSGMPEWAWKDLKKKEEKLKEAQKIEKDFETPDNPHRVAYVVFSAEQPKSNPFFHLKGQAGAACARAAVSRYNAFLFSDHHLRVDMASNQDKLDNKRSVFVGNLPFSITDEEIWSHFLKKKLTVEAVRVVRDREKGGVCKGIAYVQFFSSEDIASALKLNGSLLEGRPIRVARSTRQKKSVEKPSFSHPSASGSSSFSSPARKNHQNTVQSFSEKKFDQPPKKARKTHASFSDQRRNVKKKSPIESSGGTQKSFQGRIASTSKPLTIKKSKKTTGPTKVPTKKPSKSKK